MVAEKRDGEQVVVVGDPNHLLRIDEVWAFISKDEEGHEGLCAIQTLDGWMPLIAADKERLESLRSEAKKLAEHTPNDIVLCRFHNREEVEIIKP